MMDSVRVGYGRKRVLEGEEAMENCQSVRTI